MSSDIDGFSQIIRKQGEERRKEAGEQLRQAKKDLPNEIIKLKSLNNDTLLDRYAHWQRQYSYDPRFNVIYEKMAKAARAEILLRMKS